MWLKIIYRFIIQHVIEFTRYVGVGLMAFSAVLIGIGFQLQFAWNQHDFAIITWIFSGIIFLLSNFIYYKWGISLEKGTEPFLT